MTAILYYKQKGWDEVRERSTSYEVYDEKGNLITVCERAATINWQPEFEIKCHLVDIGIKEEVSLKKL